jgi:hypothetical protein
MTGSIAHRRGYPSATAAASTRVAAAEPPVCVCAVTDQPPKYDTDRSSMSVEHYDMYRTSRNLAYIRRRDG